VLGGGTTKGAEGAEAWSLKNGMSHRERTPRYSGGDSEMVNEPEMAGLFISF
jgi:hypothetical protein